jgi:hypothetical protein
MAPSVKDAVEFYRNLVRIAFNAGRGDLEKGITLMKESFKMPEVPYAVGIRKRFHSEGVIYQEGVVY